MPARADTCMLAEPHAKAGAPPSAVTPLLRPHPLPAPPTVNPSGVSINIARGTPPAASTAPAADTCWTGVKDFVTPHHTHSPPHPLTSHSHPPPPPRTPPARDCQQLVATRGTRWPSFIADAHRRSIKFGMFTAADSAARWDRCGCDIRERTWQTDNC